MARRNFGSAKHKVGMTQMNAVRTYLRMGMTVDEMQDHLKCPRASIRGRISQIKAEEKLLKMANSKAW